MKSKKTLLELRGEADIAGLLALEDTFERSHTGTFAGRIVETKKLKMLRARTKEVDPPRPHLKMNK